MLYFLNDVESVMMSPHKYKGVTYHVVNKVLEGFIIINNVLDCYYKFNMSNFREKLDLLYRRVIMCQDLCA